MTLEFGRLKRLQAENHKSQTLHVASIAVRSQRKLPVRQLKSIDNVAANWAAIVNILVGSLIGSYIGVDCATRINERALNRIVIVFLLFLSVVLLGHHFIFSAESFQLPSPLRIAVGFAAGIVIGVFSSMLGVAGGELIIPAIILVFAIDIKLAGSLSLAISIPTIMMGLFKYRSQSRLQKVSSEQKFIVSMASGSILGAFIGSNLLRMYPALCSI